MKPQLSDDQIFQERFNAVGMFCIAIFYGYVAYNFWGEGYARWWYELVIPDAVSNSDHARIIILNGVAITIFIGWLILYFSVTGHNFFIRHHYARVNFFAYLYGTTAFLCVLNSGFILPLYLGVFLIKKGVSVWFAAPIGIATWFFMFFGCLKLLPRLRSILGVEIIEN
tara:strand:+ start:384 stop:890 length:507 start_codon:yes stop_codon:yes gene_type:complete